MSSAAFLPPQPIAIFGIVTPIPTTRNTPNIYPLSTGVPRCCTSRKRSFWAMSPPLPFWNSAAAPRPAHGGYKDARFATGFDFSSGMLSHAEGGLPLIQADALALPYRDAAFDMAFSTFGALPFVADLDQALREVHRVLRPHGRFVFSVPHPMRWVFPDDPQDLTAELSYFEPAYLEQDDNGELSYAEFHRTMGDWVRALQVRSAFEIRNLIEPEWPEENTLTWGQWSPERGAIFPDTAIFVCEAR